MAESLPISLRASPKVDANKESLPLLIARINEQRGSFREISEESLQAEIDSAENDQLDVVDHEVAEYDQDVKPRQEQLAQAREEMFAQVQ